MLTTIFFPNYGTWSIGIYSGNSPLTIHSGYKNVINPIITAKNISDIASRGVADPFLLYDKNIFYLFFEIVTQDHDIGAIGVATSNDGITWKYEQKILEEKFHLSYPYVFKDGEKYYMIPESNAANGIRLYSATTFPSNWKFEKEIIKGKYSDSSLCYYNNRYWLFTFNTIDQALYLFFSDSITGSWTAHPANPIIKNDLNTARPGGRILVTEQSIIRFVQDDEPEYGNASRVFMIDCMTTSEYKEHELPESPILTSTGIGWNSDGMHHIDPVKLNDSLWIASVDGKSNSKIFDPLRGLKNLKSRIKKLIKTFS
jgi:hypothetical protein